MFPPNPLIWKLHLSPFLQIFVYTSYIFLNFHQNVCFSPVSPSFTLLLQLLDPLISPTHPPPPTPTNTYNHLSLPPAHSRVKCTGFLSQNMWRELIGSSVRLFPPGCFCVAVTCSPQPPPPPLLQLLPPSISLSFSFILRLAFCELSFSFYVFFLLSLSFLSVS